jgi:hypothetical protein
MILTRFLTTICLSALAGAACVAQPIFPLFDGSQPVQWVRASTGAGPILWPVVDGTLQVGPNTGAIETYQHFQDFELHVEFRCPATPPGTPEQSRGNSGIYLQNRYEIQVLDSYNWPLSGLNDCASIYNFRDAATNVARPAGEWQTYDIQFRAARWNGTTKTEQARVSVTWNGTLVHSNVSIPGPTPGGDAESSAPGPIFLQDHGDLVRFSNMWIRPLNAVAPSAPQNLVALADGTNVRLSWSLAPGRASYHVRRSMNPAGPFTMLAPFVQPACFGVGCFIDISGGEGPWYYTVSAVREGVEGPQSAPALRSRAPFLEFIPAGAAWNYLDDGSNQGTAWYAPGFNDSSWLNGHAELGYGDGDEVTVIRRDRTDGTRIITTYFRLPFQVSNVWQVTNLTVYLLRDDGGVVYLNNSEVFRGNMPGTPINYLTTALAAVADETAVYSTNINPALLVEGTNVLAVEIHQSSTNSTDVSFNLALTGIGAPLPVLAIARSGDLVDVTWAAIPTGFHLERTDHLSPAANWTRETNIVSAAGTNRFRSTTADDTFFRLARP